ncbi:hypothetical protein EB796_022782 [Bugula neritina]|uniref:Small monomeric GTPase n=1 Tax=Bugula neritina TaxID=10212 RepID=A0A7J7IZ95_BUGNE|nr:hypothetical protein EB796_022782 [Bugula neritina]
MPPKERKIAVMGFRSVGKSSLTIQFVEGMFVDSYDPTIEDTFVTEFTSARGQVYKLHVIDTAGQVSAVSYLNLAQIVYVHT